MNAKFRDYRPYISREWTYPDGMGQHAFSNIICKQKRTEMYAPSQWATVVRMARRKNPYSVVPLQYENIYDF